MKLTFKNKKIENECTDYTKAVRAYGDISAKRLHQRVKEMKSIDNLQEMVDCKIGGCHPLHGNLDGKYGLYLQHPYRLIIEPNEKCGDLSEVVVVKILEVDDYHGK